MAKLPKIVARLRRQLRDRGESRASAARHAQQYLHASGNVRADGRATPKGVRRGNMTARQRAASRARKYRRQS